MPIRSKATRRSSLPKMLSPGHLSLSSNSSGKLSPIQRTDRFPDRLVKGNRVTVRITPSKCILSNKDKPKQLRSFFMAGEGLNFYLKAEADEVT
jgi:hypothetical protein